MTSTGLPIFRHVALAAILVLAYAPSAQSKDAVCRSDLDQRPPYSHAKVFLRTDKARYSLSDSVAVEAGVMNNGTGPIYVYDWISWGYGGGLVIRIRNSRGKEITPVLRDDTMLPPPRSNDDPNMFVRLQDKGDFFGTHREMSVTDLVKAPGKYTLQIEYRSPLSCKFVAPKLQGLPALWHEDASIFSKQVPFEVTSPQHH